MPAQSLDAQTFLHQQEIQPTNLSTPSNMPSPTNRVPLPWQRRLGRQHSWNMRTGKWFAASKNLKLSVPVSINAACLLLWIHLLMSTSKAYRNHPRRKLLNLSMMDPSPCMEDKMILLHTTLSYQIFKPKRTPDMHWTNLGSRRLRVRLKGNTPPEVTSKGTGT
jgi:hypothetical protein